MSEYKVTVPYDFWRTGEFLKEKYSRDEFRAIIFIIREAINELRENGEISESGWNEHKLVHQPFADGRHFEFHTHDDDVLIVYFKRERKRHIRMIGIYDHARLPNDS